MSDEQQQRYPLAWPTGWKRSVTRHRAAFGKTETTTGAMRPDGTRPKFSTKRPLNASDAASRLQQELDRLGASDAILSTNLQLRMDGVPRSNQSEPFDPGAAVYFTLKKQPRCLACDRWTRVSDNIAAIAQHIDALRRIDRYGVGTLEQAFSGYAALPPSGEDWRIVLGLTGHATIDMVDAKYRELAKAAHPDLEGGSESQMSRLNVARDAARKELGS